MSRTRLLLVRHGETDDNRRGVFQGQGGRGLNARGREQAELLAARIGGAALRVDGLYSSDLERARETADILAAAVGCAPVPVEALREVALGAWEGLSHAEIEDRFPDEWTAWRAGRDLKRGGGESYAELTVRVVAAVDEIAAAHPGGTVIAVSHGAAIKAFTGHVLGLGVEGLRTFHAASNTGVCVVERDDEGAFRLLIWNDVAHLRDPLVDLFGRRDE